MTSATTSEAGNVRIMQRVTARGDEAESIDGERTRLLDY